MALMTGEQYIESMRKKNLQVYMFNVFRARRFASRAALTSAPKVSKPGQSSTFAI